MTKYVFIIDTSGSMYCYMANLKTYVKALIDGYTLWGTSTENKIALISFSSDVYIKSYYKNDNIALKNLVDGLSCSGMTAMHDAILTGLVFENPPPDYLLVFSELHDNSSDASQTDWSNLSSPTALDIPVILCTPSPGTYTADCFGLAPLFTTKVVTVQMAAAKAMEISKAVKTVKVFSKPEDFLELKPRPVEKK